MGLWDSVDSNIMMDMPEDNPGGFWDHMMGVTGSEAYPQLTQSINASFPSNSASQPQDFSHNDATFGTPNNVSSDASSASKGWLSGYSADAKSAVQDAVGAGGMRALKGGFTALGGSASKMAARENADIYESARRQLWSINQPGKNPIFSPAQAGRTSPTQSVNAQSLYRYWLERLREFSNIKEAVK